MGNIRNGIGVNWTCIFRSIKHKTIETCFTSICTISSHIFGKVRKWKWLKSVGHHSLYSMDFEFFGMQLMWLESVCGIQIVHRNKNHSFQWLMCHSSAFLLFFAFFPRVFARRCFDKLYIWVRAVWARSRIEFIVFIVAVSAHEYHAACITAN